MDRIPLVTDDTTPAEVRAILAKPGFRLKFGLQEHINLLALLEDAKRLMDEEAEITLSYSKVDRMPWRKIKWRLT